MNKEYLGEFEELILTMVGLLQEDAYGNTIVNEIKSQLNRKVNLSAVHVTLYRLEDKGLVKSYMFDECPWREKEKDLHDNQRRHGLIESHERIKAAVVENDPAAADNLTGGWMTEDGG